MDPNYNSEQRDFNNYNSPQQIYTKPGDQPQYQQPAPPPQNQSPPPPQYQQLLHLINLIINNLYINHNINNQFQYIKISHHMLKFHTLNPSLFNLSQVLL